MRRGVEKSCKQWKMKCKVLMKLELRRTAAQFFWFAPSIVANLEEGFVKVPEVWSVVQLRFEEFTVSGNLASAGYNET